MKKSNHFKKNQICGAKNDSSKSMHTPHIYEFFIFQSTVIEIFQSELKANLIPNLFSQGIYVCS